jgi:uncharacterized membrane protein
MTKTDEKAGTDGVTPLDALRDELGKYVGARTQHLADSFGDKLTDIAEQAGKDGAGSIPGIGRRVLGGDSPSKAFLAEKSKSAKDKVMGGVKGALGGGDGEAGDKKVTTIVEVVDIGRPLRVVYDRWTQYEDFGTFAKGVTNVDPSDDVESDWQVKVAFSNRSWTATVQEQVPDERIVWDSEGDKGTTHGAVSFHELTPDLTRVVVVIEYRPGGFFEKTGNIWRAQGRRLRLDLKHFQRYVTLTDEEPDGWRGEIRDGEVVRTHEEALDDEDDRDDEDDDYAEEAEEGYDDGEYADDEAAADGEER